MKLKDLFQAKQTNTHPANQEKNEKTITETLLLLLFILCYLTLGLSGNLLRIFKNVREQTVHL